MHVSINTVDNVEIITSSHIMEESAATCRTSDSHELLQVAVSILYKDDESWFDTYKDIDLLLDVSEILDNYDKWSKPLNTDGADGVNNESTNKCIKPDVCIGKLQT